MLKWSPIKQAQALSKVGVLSCSATPRSGSSSTRASCRPSSYYHSSPHAPFCRRSSSSSPLSSLSELSLPAPSPRLCGPQKRVRAMLWCWRGRLRRGRPKLWPPSVVEAHSERSTPRSRGRSRALPAAQHAPGAATANSSLLQESSDLLWRRKEAWRRYAC